MVPICTEWWCTEANEATQTHCYNPVASAYRIWAYYAHGRQRRCQEDSVSLPSGRLEKTTRSSPHHVAQHRPTGSETTPPYTPRSRRFGSELSSVEDDVDIWCYAVLSCMPETTTTTTCELPIHLSRSSVVTFVPGFWSCSVLLQYFCVSSASVICLVSLDTYVSFVTITVDIVLHLSFMSL